FLFHLVTLKANSTYMKFAFALLSFFISNVLLSQDEERKEPTKEGMSYHDSRLKFTTPPYGLAKVKGLIKGIKFVESEGDLGYRKLDDKKYKNLSLREKFTYNMIHAESYSQNCD